MIFVDTNVILFAVGRPHPLRDPARAFFAESARDRIPLATSAEVLQELVHAYLPLGRLNTLDAALQFVARAGLQVWSLEPDDVLLARQLHDRHPALTARDLCHLASCQRRNAQGLKSFDQVLGSVQLATHPH